MHTIRMVKIHREFHLVFENKLFTDENRSRMINRMIRILGDLPIAVILFITFVY